MDSLVVTFVETSHLITPILRYLENHQCSEECLRCGSKFFYIEIPTACPLQITLMRRAM